jgi:hypothetical protein
MVSTITILLVSVLSLYVVWTTMRPGLPPINSLQDWEANNHAVEPELFRVLLDPAEERYLRQSLSPQEFRSFQRKRMALALRWLDLVGQNAAMLLKLGQRAKTEGDPRLAKEAEDLIHGALRLRVNLMLAEPCLWLKWAFPGWAWSLPGLEIPYKELLTFLSRIQQQRQWDLTQTLLTG